MDSHFEEIKVRFSASHLDFDIRGIKTEQMIRYNLFLEFKYWSIETRQKSCSHQCS